MTLDYLLLFTDHGMNNDARLSYSRAAGAEHISIEEFQSFKSGVILDALLLILQLSKSRKYYDYYNFYKKRVADMVSITRYLQARPATCISDFFLAIHNPRSQKRLNQIS